MLFAVAPALADAQREEVDYSKRSGYFAFDPILGEMTSSVEIFLKGSLLVLAREAVKTEDPELGNVLSKIEYVRVQVFPVDEATAPKLMDKTAEMATQLEKKGWELVVRVREEGERVHVYMLPGKKDSIQGLVVMVVDKDEEAAFINIVGDVNPVEIGRIGQAFHVDAMDRQFKVQVEGDAKITVDKNDKNDNTSE